jgi:hypothetical protein
MCSAIAACHRVDEVKDLRDKAKALEVYARQAQNTDAERKAAEVRIRAERRAGELLKEMKQKGARQKEGDNAGAHRGQPKRSSSGTTTLSDLGITRDQSSKWQQLAEVPEREFEKAVSSSGPKPTTEGIVLANRLRQSPAPKMDPDALLLWGRLRDLERSDLMQRNPADVMSAMTDAMRDDVSRVLPRLLEWLKRIGVDGGKNGRAA